MAAGRAPIKIVVDMSRFSDLSEEHQRVVHEYFKANNQLEKKHADKRKAWEGLPGPWVVTEDNLESVSDSTKRWAQTNKVPLIVNLEDDSSYIYGQSIDGNSWEYHKFDAGTPELMYPHEY